MFALTLVLAVSAGSWDCDYAGEQWGELELAPPCKVGSLAEAQKKWKLTPEQAKCALDATKQPGDKYDDSKRGAAWLTCAKKWPTVWALVGGAVRQWDFKSDLTPLVDQLSPEFADRLLNLKYAAPKSLLAAHLVKKDPTRLAKLLVDDRLFDRDRGEVAWRELEAGRALADDAQFVHALLAPQLLEGHLFVAAQLWMRLPPAARTKWAKDVERLPLTGKAADGEYESLRPLLVLGLNAIGEKDAAKAIVMPPSGDAEHPLYELHVMRDAAVFVTTGQRTRTAWDAAVRLKVGRLFRTWELWASVWPFLAPHERLYEDTFVTEERDDAEAFAREMSGRDRSFVPTFEKANALALSVLDKLVTFHPARRGKRVSVASDAGVTLPPAFASPFVEKPKSTAKANVPLVVNRDAKPHGFWVQRSEKQGKRWVVLSLSQRFDPVGEVSPGGYWLSVSSDEGAHWKNVYLSLGHHRPFAALEKSNVPLLDEKDVVRLAMKEAPLDETSVTFPPIGMRAPTKRPLVILEAPLAHLERDGDGDGLSDLTEARLLLDPSNKDTDGDGVSDGDDATPRIDDRLPKTTLAEMYNAFFEDFLTGKKQPRALVLSPNGKEGDLANAVGAPRVADLEDVRFLEGSSTELAGLKPLIRIINLSTDELAAMSARYGTFYPMSLEIIVEGPDHAFVIWSERWRGGTCRIDRDASGKLVVTMLGSWIT